MQIPISDTKWSVGPDIWMVLYELAKLNIHKKILEIGCFNGYSTSAFLAAMDNNCDFELTLCDVEIKSTVKEMIRNRNVSLKETNSVNVIDSTYDFIFVDGDHSLPVVSRELMLLLSSGTKTIVAHDTMCPHLSIDNLHPEFDDKSIHTWGSILLKQVYDAHSDYFGITLYNPNIKFLWLGTSFYSKDEEIIKNIRNIANKVIPDSLWLYSNKVTKMFY